MSCDDTAQVVVRLDDDAPWMSKASTSEGDESVEMGENTEGVANDLGRRARVSPSPLRVPRLPPAACRLTTRWWWCSHQHAYVSVSSFVCVP